MLEIISKSFPAEMSHLTSGILLICLGCVLIVPTFNDLFSPTAIQVMNHSGLDGLIKRHTISLSNSDSKSIVFEYPGQCIGGIAIIIGLMCVLQTSRPRENPFKVTSSQQLRSVYGDPMKIAVVKESDHIHPAYHRFVESSPFMILATSGSSGLDASPRGDPSGVVRIVDKKTLILPDVRGNNRIDSLHNIVNNPQVGMLFLIPGVGNTMRAQGTAEIIIDKRLLQQYMVGNLTPRSLIKITVNKMYLHCSQSVDRSKIFDHHTIDNPPALPPIRDVIKSWLA